MNRSRSKSRSVKLDRSKDYRNYETLELENFHLKSKNNEFCKENVELKESKKVLQEELDMTRRQHEELQMKYNRLHHILLHTDIGARSCLTQLVQFSDDFANVMKRLQSVRESEIFGERNKEADESVKRKQGVLKPHAVNGHIIHMPTITLRRYTDKDSLNVSEASPNLVENNSVSMEEELSQINTSELEQAESDDEGLRSGSSDGSRLSAIEEGSFEDEENLESSVMEGSSAEEDTSSSRQEKNSTTRGVSTGNSSMEVDNSLTEDNSMEEESSTVEDNSSENGSSFMENRSVMESQESVREEPFVHVNLLTSEQLKKVTSRGKDLLGGSFSPLPAISPNRSFNHSSRCSPSPSSSKESKDSTYASTPKKAKSPSFASSTPQVLLDKRIVDNILKDNNQKMPARSLSKVSTIKTPVVKVKRLAHKASNELNTKAKAKENLGTSSREMISGCGRPRRAVTPKTYKEPSVNVKMRRS